MKNSLKNSELRREIGLFSATILVIANMVANLETAKAIIRYALPKMEALGDEVSCGCPSALAGAIITNPAKITAEKKKQLELLIQKYVEI